MAERLGKKPGLFRILVVPEKYRLVGKVKYRNGSLDMVWRMIRTEKELPYFSILDKHGKKKEKRTVGAGPLGEAGVGEWAGGLVGLGAFPAISISLSLGRGEWDRSEAATVES